MSRRSLGALPFADRAAAGRALAELVVPEVSGDAIVLGLPRGGVPVAAPVAEALPAPLDVLVVRKLGLPAQPELAMGAIAGVEDRVQVVRNERVLEAMRVPADVFDQVLHRELAVLREREQWYRSGVAAAPVDGRTVVLVDDGLATGSTMRAAVAALRVRGPARVIVAVPVGTVPSCAALAEEVELVLCLAQPEPFEAVGQAYRDFSATTEDEVRAILAAQ